ncbi:histone H3 methyltransferase complex and RNA cleavage factor II complex, subunit SWD2, partial [Aureobasidium melanogenum]
MGAENGQPGPMAKVSEVIATYRPTRLFKAPNLHYTSLDFDSTGELLLLARTDDTLHIYNTKAGAHAKELKSQKHGCALARFTHHSQSVIYASTKLNHDIRYLSAHDNSYIRYFKGHTDRVTSIQLCPSNDTFLSASLDNTVKLWDLRSSSPQGSLNLHGAVLTAYDPSATVIAVASPATQTIVLYDVRNYDKPPFATFDMQDIERRFSHYGQAQAQGWTTLEFSNNGQYILVGTNGPGHYVLDAFEGVLKAYLYRAQGPPPFPSQLGQSDSPLRHTQSSLQGDACFSSDGRYVVSASSKGGMLVWDLLADKRSDGTMNPMTDLPGPRTSTVVGVNPRYNNLASAGQDVVLWLPDPELA